MEVDGKLSDAHPAKSWARSLRRDTSVQDEHRRAIHDQSGNVANVGFQRWNAARCLQDQYDSARGVEHTKRLDKSRAIITRFNRRSKMTDVKRTETETSKLTTRRGNISTHKDCAFESVALAETEACVTRAQALENFGIDLCRMRKLTTMWPAFRKSPELDKTFAINTPTTKDISETSMAAPSSGTQVIGRSDKQGTGDGSGRDLRNQNGSSRTTAAGRMLEALEELLSNDVLNGPSAPPAEEASTWSGRREDESDDAHDDNDEDKSIVGTEGSRQKHAKAKGFLPSAADVTVISDDTHAERSSGGCHDDGAISTIQEPDQMLIDSRSRVESPMTSLGGLMRSGRVAHADDAQSRTEAPSDVDNVDTEIAHRDEVGVAKAITMTGSKREEEVIQERRKTREEVSAKLVGNAFPKHRPCWRWMSLLAPGMRSSCTIPVTVYLGPVASRRGDSSGDIPERVDGGDPIASPSAGEASTMNAGCFLARDTTKSSALDQTLLWAFSQAEETRPFARSTREERERTRENGDACSRKSVCGGVLTDREGTIRSTCETKARFCCDVNNPNGSPPAHTQEQCTDCPSLRGSPPSHQDMLRTELIRGEEDLLRASRAICEGGRRDGGSREGICNRDKAFKYPVALLKVWARERPSDDQNHVRRTISSRRRLRVVSLWTEGEVLEALRDLLRRKRRRPSKDNDVRLTTSSMGTTAKGGENSSKVNPTAASSFSRKAPDLTPAGSSSLVSQDPFDLKNADDMDAYCVQAFVKAVDYSTSCTTAALPPSDAVVPSATTVVAGSKTTSENPGSAIVSSGENRMTTSVSNIPTRRDVATASAALAGFAGPVFYRAAWRRRVGTTHVWKLTSRYPYVSNLAAHLCPLVGAGAGSQGCPSTAAHAEERVVALASTKTEAFAKMFATACDLTLQRLWADWAIRETDGQWILVEVHGVKTEADLQESAAKAAAAKESAAIAAEATSKVYAGQHNIPPSHFFCGDTEDLKARVATARPTQGIPLAEVAKRLALATTASAPKRQRPSRPPTPSKVSHKTKETLGRREAADGVGRGSRGKRRMANQYWRCAGDFCEIRSSTERSGAVGGDSGKRKCKKVAHRVTDTELDIAGVEKSMAPCGGESGKRNGEDRTGGTVGDEDIVGKRKHALAVEIPRTVLFRLVLNARAALLGWRASAADFALMEKPVQLCSACHAICDALERRRIETTRRAMAAEEINQREKKAKLERKPPGWKSRVQNALTSVDAKLRRDDDRDEKNAETRAGTMKDDDGDRAKEKHQRSREPRSKREIRARRKAKERARMCLYREQVRHQTSKAAGSHNGAPTTGSECREQICRGAAAGASVREEVRRLLRKPENERDTNKGDGGLLSPLDRGMSGLPRLVLQPTSPGISLSLGPVGTNGLDLREIGQHGRSETGAREACGANHDDRARSKNDSQREKSIGATATRPRDACREGGVDGGDDHVADDVVARSPTSPCEEEDTPRGKRGCDVPVKSVAVLLPLDSVKGGTARGDPPAGYLREGRISQHLARPKEMQDTVQERAADEEHEKRRCLADLGVGAGGYPPKQQDVEEGAALGGSDCAQSDYATDEFEDTDDDSVRSVS